MSVVHRFRKTSSNEGFPEWLRTGIQRGEKMEGAEEMGGRVGHRHVPVVAGISLRQLLFGVCFARLGTSTCSSSEPGMRFTRRLKNCNPKVPGAGWVYISHLTNGVVARVREWHGCG